MSTVIDRPAGGALRELRGSRPSAQTTPPPAQQRGRLKRLVLGAPEDPAWSRPALLGVLLVSALLIGWGLTRSGMSNTYYAAAVKSATVSWKAWFFGAIDPGSFITVDKPPLAMWMMGLSGRILGFSSFSMLLPDAICGVAAVAVLHATVKRTLGHLPALFAALALAVSPVSVAVAKVNNPDALLVLLLVLSGYLTVRALESGRTKWLAWAGAAVGLAFMTKMLQGWMVAPALGVVYLWAGPPALGTRIRQLLAAGASMVAVSAAWPLAVTLWPGSTPYIGGSTDGSVWDLILGYNGFGRVFGENGGGGGMTFGGAPSWLRMFNTQVGGQIAWLLPLALVGLLAGLYLTRRAPRTDLKRAAWLLFGMWGLVHFVVFSKAEGIFHPYYVSALAPAVAVLAGGGLAELLGVARRSWAGVAALITGVVASAWVAVAILARTPDFAPWLSTAIPVGAAVAVYGAVALQVPRLLPRRLPAVAAVAALFAVGAGPASYAIATSGQGVSGNNVTAGPSVAGGFGGPGGPGGGFGAQRSSTALISYLEQHQGSAKYLVAVSGSQSSAGLIIATGKAVVTMGGFNGQDPAPTLAQFEQLVSSGQLRYVILGGGMGGGPGGGSSSSSSEIQTWVQSHGTAITVDGTTIYRLSA